MKNFISSSHIHHDFFLPVNLTGKEIRFAHLNGEVRHTLSPDGSAYVCEERTRTHYCINISGGVYSIRSIKREVVGLPDRDYICPEGEEDLFAPKVYLVTEEVAHAVPDREDVFVVDNPVYDKDGKIIGYMGIAHV